MTIRALGDHFSRVAPAYASSRPGYPEALFDYLASLPPRTSLAWDCAAGTGQASIPLASRFNQVIATDVSIAMLSQASPHPRVEYRAVPAEASGLADRTVDLITVAQALHWLDLDRFYAEARRVLATGGVLAAWTYGRQQFGDGTLDELLDRFYREVIGPYWPAGRSHVEAGYRELPFPFAELDAPRFFMEEHWTLRQVLDYVGTWSATQRYREQVGHDPLPRLETDLAAHWGPHPIRTVRWPLSARVGFGP
jgi:SAM-dependent methyltransferase